MQHRNHWYKTLLTSLLLIGALSSYGTEITSSIETAVNNPARLEVDTKRDAGRKPAQILQFSTIKSGDSVLDLFAGAGYYSELISRLVGDEGKVISHNNKAYIDYLAEAANTHYADNRLPNVQRIVTEANSLTLEDDSIDVAMLILTFHDFYYTSEGWKKIDVADLLSRIKHALKDDGKVIIVDHMAVSGSGEEMGSTLHRIDPAIVKAKMSEAGFKLVEEADFLINPDDPLTISMGDPKIRGNTSRFILKYKK